jgi:Nanos RNA binding domain
MSKSNSSNYTSSTVTFKMECRFCIDAGMPASKYTTHFTKDKCGNVVCPLLLKHRCETCDSKGHTRSYCTAKVIPLDLSKEKHVKRVNKSSAKVTPINKFALLDSDEEGEEEHNNEDKKDKKDKKEQKQEPVTLPMFTKKDFPALKSQSSWYTMYDSADEDEDEE